MMDLIGLKSPSPDGRAISDGLVDRHYENFPLRAPFLPARERADLAAIYAFCRTTDDLGDEAAGDRLTGLAEWRAAVEAALTGRAPADRPALVALGRVARERDLDPDLFLRLIEANVRDQTVDRYADRAALLEYCELSATPVGRMVLGVIGVRDAAVAALSDATCVGLQLANFWQDLARDWAQGRCYLPLEDCRRHGVDPRAELGMAVASPALRGLVAEEVAWARDRLAEGWPLADRLSSRWRPLVRGFTRGGWGILDRIVAQGHDTLRARPEMSSGARARIVLAECARARRTGVRLPRAAVA